MENCVFCMIGRGDLKARVVYEDDEVIAFDDIAPQAPVHTLVVPREHYGSLNDAIPSALLAKLLLVVRKVAELKGVSTSGYRVIVNNGPDATQTVGHLHLHVLGGKRMSHGMVGFDE